MRIVSIDTKSLLREIQNPALKAIANCQKAFDFVRRNLYLCRFCIPCPHFAIQNEHFFVGQSQSMHYFAKIVYSLLTFGTAVSNECIFGIGPRRAITGSYRHAAAQEFMRP